MQKCHSASRRTAQPQSFDAGAGWPASRLQKATRAAPTKTASPSQPSPAIPFCSFVGGSKRRIHALVKLFCNLLQLFCSAIGPVDSFSSNWAFGHPEFPPPQPHHTTISFIYITTAKLLPNHHHQIMSLPRDRAHDSHAAYTIVTASSPARPSWPTTRAGSSGL